MDTVIALLQIGAYSLPQKVLANEKLNIHVQDVLKKDLIRCLNEIRQGSKHSLKIIKNWNISV